MLGNTQNKDNAKEENKKLNFWFWLFSGLAVICAIFFVFAAISLLGMAFPGVFGGLWAGISKVPFIAGIFSSVLFNVIDVVIMPMVFVFCVREAREAKKEIKSHVTDENKEDNQDEVEELKANDEDKNKNEMKQNKEKNENHLENKIDENKVSQEANENNNKENKNNESKERKPAKTVGEIADIFLADTLDLMSEGDVIQDPKLPDDWRGAYGKLPGKIPKRQMWEIVDRKREQLARKGW